MSALRIGLQIEQLRQLANGDLAADEHLRELLETLGSEDEELRARAGDALETIESLPVAAVTLLNEGSKNPSQVVASWSCKLISRCGAVSGVEEALVSALQKRSELGVRQQAALSLGKLPKLSAAAIEALRSASENRDPRLQRLASEALKNHI